MSEEAEYLVVVVAHAKAKRTDPAAPDLAVEGWDRDTIYRDPAYGSDAYQVRFEQDVRFRTTGLAAALHQGASHAGPFAAPAGWELLEVNMYADEPMKMDDAAEAAPEASGPKF